MTYIGVSAGNKTSNIMVELSPESVTVSLTDELPYVKFDSATLKKKHSLEEMLSTPEHNNNICCYKNIAADRNIISEQREGRNVVLPRYSANELVNICYAKIWRGDANFLDEENELYDSVTNRVFLSYFDEDLDKLQKLRLKSKCKTRRDTKKAEVKEWIENAEKFINVLSAIRDLRNYNSSWIETDINSQLKGSVNAEVQLPNETAKQLSSFERRDKHKAKNQVHFPGHVLLCAALQEDEPKEVEKVIKNYQINLNELTRVTGYHYLHKTIGNGQMHCATILIQSGIDVNEEDSDGNSPLALAFSLMNFQMVALLVDSGANLFEYTKFRVNELQKVKELSCSVLKVFEMDL